MCVCCKGTILIANISSAFLFVIMCSVLLYFTVLFCILFYRKHLSVLNRGLHI